MVIGCNKNNNEHKYVFKVNKNIQYIFYYEGDTNIEDVTVDGKYIVIDLKKGYVKQNFGTDSLSVIKSMEVIDESN